MVTGEIFQMMSILLNVLDAEEHFASGVKKMDHMLADYSTAKGVMKNMKMTIEENQFG